MIDKKIEYLIDVFIQDGQENDDCLHRPGFNIDIKLFAENAVFNSIIHKIIDYMKMILLSKFKDYGKLKGISGANIGIPFNIVATLYDGVIEVFINPVILKVSRSKTNVLSNCGSINLPKAIKVERHSWVLVKWMDVGGEHHEENFSVTNSKKACTLQHEIDHNQGILITDLITDLNIRSFFP